MIEPDAWSHDNHSFLPVVEPMQSSGTNQQLLIRDLTFKFSPHSSRVQGRFLNTPLFQSLDGFMTPLGCGVRSQPYSSPSYSFALNLPSNGLFSPYIGFALV